jgi:hypothetical protein|tara:strand:+ start:637 stop:867 length:231 start_codon:yes stop_codon:yes gene_type:complete
MFQKFLFKQMGGKASADPLRVFLIFLVAFLSKSVIVMITYNKVGPKITANVGGSDFTPLKFTDAMILTVLVNSLLS